MPAFLRQHPCVIAWAGPAFASRAVLEERGEIYSAPEVLETTNRYNKNDGVSKRVHELAFGIVNCFTLWCGLGCCHGHRSRTMTVSSLKQFKTHFTGKRNFKLSLAIRIVLVGY